MEKRKAVVILSGGIESTTTLAIAEHLGYEPYTLTFNYGQANCVETLFASRIAQDKGLVHKEVNLDLPYLLKSNFFRGETSGLPQRREVKEILGDGPNYEYVPCRNIIFMSFALAYAESIDADRIYTGVTNSPNCPDTTRDFISSFRMVSDNCTMRAKNGKRIEIHAPLMDIAGSKVIQMGIILGVDFGKTISCFMPMGELSCAICDRCIIRKLMFKNAGVEDTTKYVEVYDPNG